MSLTARATIYLSKQEIRKDAVKSLDIIEKAFREKKVSATKELLNFQKKYGGLIIYVGLEPICFGLIHGNLIRGSEFGNPKKLVNEILHK